MCKYYFPHFSNKETDLHRKYVNWQNFKAISFTDGATLIPAHQSEVTCLCDTSRK